jgi:hypothetical protein
MCFVFSRKLVYKYYLDEVHASKELVILVNYKLIDAHWAIEPWPSCWIVWNWVILIENTVKEMDKHICSWILYIILNVSYKIGINGLICSSFLPQTVVSWKNSKFETMHVFFLNALLHSFVWFESRAGLGFESNFIHEKQE